MFVLLKINILGVVSFIVFHQLFFICLFYYY